MEEILKNLKILKNNGLNPKDFVMQQIGNKNPIFSQLMNMANSNNSSGIESFARNICKERGIDFDTEFKSFMQKIG